MTRQRLPQYLVTAPSQHVYASVPGGTGQPYYPHAAGSWGGHSSAPEAAEAVAAGNPQSLEARRVAYLEEALANSHASTYDRSLATAERGFRQTLLSCILGKTMIQATKTQKNMYDKQAKRHTEALQTLREKHAVALQQARAPRDQRMAARTVSL